jgi:ubiquinone/menaquinone biosynthesis C-methylase UbiE
VVYDSGVERERVARVAGRLMWGVDTRTLYADIARLRSLPAGAAVLDVPCGGGVAFRGLSRSQDVRYVAADISPVMIRRARREAERRGVAGLVEIAEADAEALPFDDASFDLCISYNSLHCFAHPERALAEMGRVLRPGGELRGTSAVIGEGARYDRLIALYRRIGIFGRVGTAAGLCGWLENAGLADARVDASGAVAFFSARRPG